MGLTKKELKIGLKLKQTREGVQLTSGELSYRWKEELYLKSRSNLQLILY